MKTIIWWSFVFFLFKLNIPGFWLTTCWEGYKKAWGTVSDPKGTYSINRRKTLYHKRSIWTLESDFPSGSDGKESACNAGDWDLIPGLRRSPGEGNGNPLQYFGLENPMDRGAWQATFHGVTKMSDRTYKLNHHQTLGIKTHNSRYHKSIQNLLTDQSYWHYFRCSDKKGNKKEITII